MSVDESSTAISKSNEHEDIFKMIEEGRVSDLKKMLHHIPATKMEPTFGEKPQNVES